MLPTMAVKIQNAGVSVEDFMAALHADHPGMSPIGPESSNPDSNRESIEDAVARILEEKMAAREANANKTHPTSNRGGTINGLIKPTPGTTEIMGPPEPRPEDMQSEIRDDKGNLTVAPNKDDSPSGGTTDKTEVSTDAAIKGIKEAGAGGEMDPLDKRAEMLERRKRAEQLRAEEMRNRLLQHYNIDMPEGSTLATLKERMAQAVREGGPKGPQKRNVRINGQQWKPDLVAAAEKTAAYERGRIAAQYGVDDQTAALMQRQRHDSRALEQGGARENYNMYDALFRESQNQVPSSGQRAKEATRDPMTNILNGS